MKKIGFIDYYLSEWHANNYPAWIAAESKKLPDELKCEVAYAWGELEVSPVDGVTSEEWCKKNKVTLCSSIEEVCEKSDYVIVLAPSNPEKHLGYAEKVLPFGKNTYIDKTFAPDYATAKKIFDIAEKHGTKFFSTSALRFADELKDFEAKRIIVKGGGSNFDEYAIHLIEILVKVLGVGADELMVTYHDAENEADRGYSVEVEYIGRRCATLIYAPALGYEVLTTVAGGKTQRDCVKSVPIKSAFFNNLIKAMLQFFASGEPPFDPAETLEVARIREMAIYGKDHNDSKCVQVWGKPREYDRDNFGECEKEHMLPMDALVAQRLAERSNKR